MAVGGVSVAAGSIRSIVVGGVSIAVDSGSHSRVDSGAGSSITVGRSVSSGVGRSGITITVVSVPGISLGLSLGLSGPLAKSMAVGGVSVASGSIGSRVGTVCPGGIRISIAVDGRSHGRVDSGAGSGITVGRSVSGGVGRCGITITIVSVPGISLSFRLGLSLGVDSSYKANLNNSSII
jgi:hypothetical protein